jgi:hypothetical protein
MFHLDEPELASFPHAHCSSCKRDVVVYRELDDEQDFTYHCVDCDTATSEPGVFEWTAKEAETLGYQLETTVPEGGGCGEGSCSH